MLHRNSIIAFIALLFLIVSAPVARCGELVAYGQNPGPESGYGHVMGDQLFDGPSEFMLFSDYPLDQPDLESEKSPEDISTSELLHAYDAASSDSADQYAAEDDPGAQTPVIEALEKDITSPLTVIKDDIHEPVERNIRLFTDRMGERFKMWLSRSGRYVGMMKEIFRENGLPEDLVYVALIESGFNPKAYSWAKASGPWQFIQGTGKKYGLKINWWVDERRDPVKSTRAAASYLRDLYDMFGTWSLAMAAYNAGEGRVNRAVQKNGTLDYWKIRKTRSLARETREYVPRYIAAKAIALDPPSYGIEGIEYEQPFEYEVVELDVPMGLDVAAKCCGTDTNSIKALNPELRRWCTPPNTPGYMLRVPKGTSGLFAANFEKLPDSEKTGWSEYVVRRGDTLGRIAGKYNIPVSEIARMNNIRRVSMISVGQRLVIPAPGATTVAYDGSSAGARYASYEDTGSHGGTYRVRRGDNLWSIARRFGMSATRLASMNGLSTRSTIYPGQKLKLSGSAVASAVASPFTTGGSYKVRRGDTLSAIARRHGMSVDELAAVNGISRRSTLMPGQRLKVGAGSQATSSTSGTYRVRSGDTLWDISRRLGVSMNTLMRANSLGKRSVLRPGQELVIPAKGGMET